MVGLKISDGRIVFSIIEYITKRYKKKDNGYAYNLFSRLKAKPKYKELEEYVVDAKLGGSKKSMTPCTCVIGLQVLLGILDDEVGVEYRKFARTTVTRVGAGDPTLKDVIDANAASSAPNAQLLRQALAQERAAGGASIAPPPEQVLAVHMVCFCFTCSDLGTACRCLLYSARRTWGSSARQLKTSRSIIGRTTRGRSR